MRARAVRFVAVGAAGFVLQLGALALLTTAAGWPYLPATAAAVELAVLHNFWWHERWTWRDRAATRDELAGRVARYHVTTGITSVSGGVIFTSAFVALAGLDAIAANAAAVAVMSLANFVVSDRWVFARSATTTTLADRSETAAAFDRRGIPSGCVAPPAKTPDILGRRALPAGRIAGLGATWQVRHGLLALTLLSPAVASGAELKPETVAAWERYVMDAEHRLEAADHIDAAGREPRGETIAVPGGVIHRWHGSILIRAVTVDDLVRALMYPGTPPPQEDVLESRVLGRSDDSLRVYLKLVRRTIMTVTYDTEHEMTFRRHSPRLATSRSVATKIAEVGGGDRGFLWRLHSYWRYAQVGNDVRVNLESLSLSREVPLVLRPIAGPIIGRIARESLTRTLEALRRYLEKA